jgi:Periplasmic binding protein
VVVGVAIAVIVPALSDSGDDAGPATTAASTSTSATETSVASTESTSPSAGTSPAETTVPAAPTYPLSFKQATEQGIADSIDWGTRCDTSTGKLAVPDFFAQPCFAPFTGDNGGATAPGVTGDEITIVYYEGQETDPIIAYITDAVKVDDTNGDQFATMKELVHYYETYYELYGRKVNLITFEGTGNALDEVAARADAAQIALEYKPFVVFGGPAFTSAFADELAAHDVICIGCTPGQPASFYSDRDPYVWGLDGSPLQKQQHVVEFLTKQIIGKNAVHGGDAVKDQPRKLGLLYLENSGAAKELADTFAANMEAAGSPFAEVVAYQLDPATIQATATQVITRMKAAGVTTVVFNGDPVAPRDFTKEATAQEYFPEWVVSASTLVDVSAFARTYDQEQWKHAFGVTQLAARTPTDQIGSFYIYKWFTGSDPPADGSIGVLSPNPALFFAVVQGAGPDLTPETFRDATFALPGTSDGLVISQPFLSYGEHGYWPEKDYLGVDDATAIWWDPAATGPDEIRKDGVGMYQFVDGGQRYLPGEWPTTDKMFDPTGAVALYTSPPPGEAPGDYPSPAG